jgi:ribonuclease T2
VLCACLLLAACGPDGDAQTHKTDAAGHENVGRFDFYVFALSWSPSYCITARDKVDNQQCGANTHYAFIVHGLWPQFESGYPENCPTDQPKSVAKALAKRFEDLTPSTGLIRHEWQKHGTCSGLTQVKYFEKLRAAREQIVIPAEFKTISRDRKMSPQAVEEAFLKANKVLPRDGIAVTCGPRYLKEVRICLTKELDFRPCAEVDKDMCRLNSVFVPAPD